MSLPLPNTELTKSTTPGLDDIAARFEYRDGLGSGARGNDGAGVSQHGFESHEIRRRIIYCQNIDRRR